MADGRLLVNRVASPSIRLVGFTHPLHCRRACLLACLSRRYFRRVWGSAPFIDANFRMWLSGALKGEFSKPNRVVKGQTTKALPAALRYFDSRLSAAAGGAAGAAAATFLNKQRVKRRAHARCRSDSDFSLSLVRRYNGRYDPIIDTPYDSAYDLFSQATPDLTGHGEFYLKPRKLPKATPTGALSVDSSVLICPRACRTRTP